MARKPRLTDEQKALIGARDDERRRFETRKAWFSMEMRRQELNRYQMAMDEGMYDSEHWTADEAAEVRRRGQNPVVHNEIKPTIDWLIGTERRMRRDFKVLARNDNTPEASDDAEVKTKLLKYLQDVNRAPFERSQACDDAWKAGMGWLEVGVRADPEDEPIYVRAESWRNVVHDSLATKRDLSDARYIFRFREVDLDVAQAYFPDKAVELEKAANADEGSSIFNSSWTNGWPMGGILGKAELPAKWLHYDADAWLFNPRKRVLLIECWSYEPSKETTGAGPGTHDRNRMRMRVAIMTEFDTILETWSPYKHNRFPFVPVWAYRRKKDGLPYSPIRPIRGPQEDLNKRMSKAQFMLSVNQLRVESGAIDPEVMSKEEVRDEMAAPDGIIEFAPGALTGNKVQVREHLDIAQGHLALAERDIMAIRSASGITGENRGQETSAKSGKAIIAKQEQGSMVTAELFDNLLLAHQIEGELCISLIEQYYTERKVFSVTGDRYKLDYTVINDVDPATGQRLNDVTAHKAQFVIGEAPWRQQLAESAFESAMNMLGALAPVAPQVVSSIIDLVFEWSDLPNKQTILQRIRQATGMSDPDGGDTPEQQAERAQKQQQAQEQFALQMRDLRATIREKELKGEKLDAEAVSKRLEALYMSAQAAQVLATLPETAPVADELARSVGFVDRAAPQVIDMPQQARPAPQPDVTVPELQQTDGARQGIETPAPDGVIQP